MLRKRDSGTTTQIKKQLDASLDQMKEATKFEIAKLCDEILLKTRSSAEFDDCVAADLRNVKAFFSNLNNPAPQPNSAETPHKLRKKVSKRKTISSRKVEPEFKDVTDELMVASTSTTTSTPKSDSAIVERPVTNGLRKSQSI